MAKNKSNTTILPDIQKVSIKQDTDKFNVFIRDYWKYYLMLEEEFLDTFKYVEFSKENYKTFSLEYLKLFQAVCSEIDVVGKTMAGEVYALTSIKFIPEDANIHIWWFALQNNYQKSEDGSLKLLRDKSVKANEMIEMNPWFGFEVEKCQNVINRKKSEYIRLKQDISGKTIGKTPTWWNAYNDVKHQRTAAIKCTSKTNYSKANLENLCNAFSALYILEWSYFSTIGNDIQISELDRSKLFEGTPKSTRVTHI